MSDTRVLIIARQRADAPELLRAVADRAAKGPCSFTLLVPSSPRGLHRVVDPEDHGSDVAQARIDAALPSLSLAAGGNVGGLIGSHDPLAAVHDAVNLLGFDEAIVSMPSLRLARWLHLDLLRKIRAVGLHVTEVSNAKPGRKSRPQSSVTATATSQRPTGLTLS